MAGIAGLDPRAASRKPSATVSAVNSFIGDSDMFTFIATTTPSSGNITQAVVPPTDPPPWLTIVRPLKSFPTKNPIPYPVSFPSLVVCDRHHIFLVSSFRNPLTSAEPNRTRSLGVDTQPPAAHLLLQST